MNLYHKVAFLFSALSFGIALQIIMEYVSQKKYVCNDNVSDSKITMLQTLEFLYILVACALVYTFMLNIETIKNNYNYARTAAICFGVFSTGILLAYLIFQSTICADKCLNSSTVLNAMKAGRSNFQDPRVVKFIHETSVMTGVPAPSSGYIDNALTPVWFQTRNNYCKSKMQTLPGGDDYSESVAERCMVWACTKEILDDVELTDATFIFGLVVQCVLSFFIIYQYRPSITNNEDSDDDNNNENQKAQTPENKVYQSLPQIKLDSPKPQQGELHPSRKRVTSFRYNKLPQNDIYF